ncbi:hypothetical protein YUBABA_00810 [Serratia phage vB_SmaM-Yubaba]|nr:hypothetical protein YUBABA_00810 [Serratia phage vB_SmaM-Yubaba]
MNNKQSSVVPFKVRSAQTGTDITENIKLTSVESKGTSVPFFKANDNDTFTVINADQNEDKLIDAVFKFDVTDLNKTYSLQAESKVNVKKYAAGTFEAKVLTNNGLFLNGAVKQQRYFDYVAKYQGQELPNTEFLFLSGSNVFNGYASFDKEENLPDGKTNRVYYTPLYEANGNTIDFKILRKNASDSTLVGDGNCIVPMRAIFAKNASGSLNAFFPNTSDAGVVGPLNAIVRIYPIVTWNGNVVPLNSPALKIAKLDKTTVTPNQSGASKFNILGTTETYIECKITSVKPTPGRNPGFTWRLTYGNVDLDLNGSNVLLKDGILDPIELTNLKPLNPNALQKLTFTASLSKTAEWSAFLSVSGAIFASGSLIIRSKNNSAIISSADISGLTPDQVGRYIKELTTPGVESIVTVSGVIDCYRIRGSENMAGTTPVAIKPLIIDVAEGKYSSYAMPAEKLNNTGDNYVIIGIKEENQDKFSGASVTNFKATGALDKASAPSLNADGSFAINIIGNKNNGEVLVTADIIGPAPESRTYKYSKTLMVSGNDQIVITPKTVPVKVWDSLSEVPFTVTSSGTDVTSQIRNLKLVANEYIKEDPENPGHWVVDTAPTAGASKSTFFTFEVNVTGNWKPKVAYGIYQIAAWSGKVLDVTMKEKVIGASTAQDTNYELVGTFKGKPAGNMLELVNHGSLDVNVKLVSQTPSGDNNSLKVTIRASTSLTSPNRTNAPTVTSLKVKLKGTDGNIENLNAVTINDINYFVMGDILGVYGMGSGISGALGSVQFPRTNINGTGSQTELYLFKNGVRVPLDSPDIEFYPRIGTVSGNDRGEIACTLAGGLGTTLYLKITRGFIGNNNGYYNPWRFRLASDPDKYKCEPAPNDANFWVYPNSSTQVQDTVLDTADTVIPGIKNKIKFTLKNSNNKLTNPRLLSNKIIPIPTNGNAIILSEGYTLEKDPTDQSKFILEFTAGTSGTSLRITGPVSDPTFSGLSYLNVEIPVPKAEFVTEPIDTEFNGVKGAETEMKFKITLGGKPATGVTIKGGGLGSGGSVVSPKNFKEIGDGVYSVVVTGAGVEGKGFVAFTLTNGTIETQSYLDPIYAVIDSSNFKLVLDQTEISGSKGSRITVNGKLTNGETNYNLDDFGVAWSIEPSDVISIAMRSKTALTFEILQEVPYDKAVSVKVKANAGGMVTESPLDVKLVGALVVTKTDPTVNVWDKSDTSPLKFTLGGKDVTSNVNSISFIETDLVKHNGLKGGYQIISDKAISLTKQNVEYTYKYAADSEEVKVTVPFTINSYDGKELVITHRYGDTSKGPNGEFLTYTGGYAPVYFSGKLKGIPVGELTVTQLSGAQYVKPDATPLGYNSTTKETTYRFNGNASNTVVNGAMTLKVKIKSATSDVEGIDYVVDMMGITVIKDEETLYASQPDPYVFKGKFGDEQLTKLIVYYGKTQVPLTDSKLVVGPTNDSKVTVVANSLSKDSLKLQFTSDTDAEIPNTGFSISLKYTNPSNVVKTANASMVYNQLPRYQQLTLGEGFQTTGEGDVETPVTLKQFVLKPE